MAALNLVGDYLLFIGKVTVAVINTAVFCLLFRHDDYFAANLSSVILPGTVVFLLSYMTASMFMIVFETIIDTTFLCFLVDYEHNKGGRMMASKGLQRLVDDHAELSHQEATIQHQQKRAYKGPDDEYSHLADVNL